MNTLRHAWRLAALAVLGTALACSGNETTAPNNPEIPPPPPPPPPATAVLLKEIVIPNLPSPYYHFEYDTTGRVSVASFASGFTNYGVQYAGDKIDALANNTAGNQDKLQYAYDGMGRVSSVSYLAPNGVARAVVRLSYDGQRLTGLQRTRRIDSAFVLEKTMSFSYYGDGNVEEIVEHYLPIADHQDEATTRDRFERYDDKINVDGFSLIHDEFFDHLVLLPGVVLQKGNPARQIHTGDGVNYTIDYSYIYDGMNRPLTKNGVFVFTNGADAGKPFVTQSNFSYY